MLNKRFAVSALTALVALTLAAAPVAANGRPLKAEMTGANVVPVPGDTDGSGTARLRLNQGRHRICYRIEVTGIVLDATAAHIHEGAAGVVGVVPVVDLGALDAEGSAQGCVTGVERKLIKAIRKHPAQFYVDVHTTEFPDGAVRGQLGRWAPGKP
jgi:hypothetical protein